MSLQSQVAPPIVYSNVRLESVYRLNTLVKNRVIGEHISIERLLPILKAHLISHPKLSGTKLLL